MRTPLRRRTGLLSKPGRGFCQYLALFAQYPVLTPQPMEFLALGRDQAAVIERRLLDPFADRVRRGLQLARQLLDATPRARQLDDSAPVFRCIGWMGSWHWGTPSSFLPNTLYESRSTPVYRRVRIGVVGPS